MKCSGSSEPTLVVDMSISIAAMASSSSSSLPPQVTAAVELKKRQEANPSFLGYDIGLAQSKSCYHEPRMSDTFTDEHS